MIHWTLEIISSIPNCIDGESEAWEEKCPRAQVRPLKSSTQQAWLALALLPSVFLLFICFHALVCSCYWYICPLLHSGFSPIETLGSVLGLIWNLCLTPGLELVLFLSLLSLFPSGSSLGLSDSPTFAGCDTLRGKNRAWCQSAWVLCFIYSDTLLPGISISLQKGKASLNVILCMWTTKWVWVHFNFALSFPFFFFFAI